MDSKNTIKRRGRPKKVEEKKNYNDLRIISFEANFDTSSPNSTIATIRHDGAKLMLEIPQNQIDSLMKLVKEGKDKSFDVYIDVDKILRESMASLITEKINFFNEFVEKLDVKELRLHLSNICSDDKTIDIDKLTNDQIKAVSILCVYDRDNLSDDRDVAYILKIPLSTIKVWNNDILFRKVRNKLSDFNLKHASGDILRLSYKEALRRPDSNSMKYILTYLGLIKEGTNIIQNFNAFEKEKQATADYLDQVLKETLGTNDIREQ